MAWYLSAIVFYIAAIGGWIANIVKLVHMTGDWTTFMVLRVVGIVVAPLGAVLGFL